MVSLILLAAFSLSSPGWLLLMENRVMTPGVGDGGKVRLGGVGGQQRLKPRGRGAGKGKQVSPTRTQQPDSSTHGLSQSE